MARAKKVIQTELRVTAKTMAAPMKAMAMRMKAQLD
jgi:hypothetical protein